MKNITIAIFDDNQPRRELLQMVINGMEGLECKGVFEDCRDVLQKIAPIMPDVILMDIDMPYVNGIEGLRLIHQQFPQIKVIMQTVFDDDEKIFDAICAGANGYLLKKTSPSKLIDAIHEVQEGGAPMTPSIARQVLLLFNNKHSKIPKNDFDLTARELEILGLLVKGMSYKMIGEACHISYATVNKHISNIYEKLQVNTAVEAVTKAIGHKIV